MLVIIPGLITAISAIIIASALLLAFAILDGDVCDNDGVKVDEEADGEADEEMVAGGNKPELVPALLLATEFRNFDRAA